MANGRTGSFGSSLLAVFLAIQASLSAGDPAPDCNRNGKPDAEDLAQGSSPDGNGNGKPDECESRVRLIEVGPSEVAIAVEHSAPMRGYKIIVAYESSIIQTLPTDRQAPDSICGSAGYYYIAQATCPTGNTDRLLVIECTTNVTGHQPAVEHISQALRFPSMTDGSCSELRLIDCAIYEDGTPVENGFLTQDGRFIPFERMEGSKVCKYDAEVFMRGDADGNGQWDMADAVRTLEYLFAGGPAPSCLDAADVADSGRINIGSAIYILFWLFQEGSGPRLPAFQCGFDPTPDALDCASYAFCPFE